MFKLDKRKDFILNPDGSYSREEPLKEYINK